ncbi:MAG: isochorismate synthase [Acidimicrobiales bacterium]|jgi:isochorismate synthase
MQSHSVRLDRAIDPLELGARTAMLWSRHGLLLAGIGVAVRIPIVRPSGAGQAQQELAALRGQDEIGVPASGPVAFAAMPFDREAPGELIVPQVVVGHDPAGNRWMTTTGITLTQGMEQARQILAEEPSRPQVTTYELMSAVTPELWRDQVVAPARDRIKAGEFNKVVLARELLLKTDQPIDVSAVLRRLNQAFSTAIIFAVDGFIGASPELLVSREVDLVRAHPLAGTAPRSSDPVRDAELAVALNLSTKDQREHRITIDWLLDTLLPYCSYVDAEPEPAIITLPNVHHLGTRVEGRLSSPAASVLELVAALHPTPAVGGDPQDLALKVINTAEPGDRGLYAGPVGWVDGEGNGEFAVGLRSSHVTGDAASIWAGVGVVGESDPESELAETRAKFQAMLGALLRP